ncbi:hypothetical protein EYF80_049516 [Liparis tanakae]|uniref:Uncharacterized protein n=1 Tax=Liparis tanakae TaxID=230148 RepID=A0A4Z2FHD8_9TELE|nr:hypothetical protein EYF80_049516 [Liparis tanakae]
MHRQPYGGAPGGVERAFCQRPQSNTSPQGDVIHYTTSEELDVEAVRRETCRHGTEDTSGAEHDISQFAWDEREHGNATEMCPPMFSPVTTAGDDVREVETFTQETRK